jgi:hypothetical protein
MSTANFPSVLAKGPKRRLEALCAHTCVSVSSGVAGEALLPRIKATSGPDGFTMEVSDQREGSNPLFSLECIPSAATWQGWPEAMSLWIADRYGNLHTCVGPEQDLTRSEALSSGDRIIALSSSLTRGLERLELTLEMALCDNPSPTTACSWILDAADELALAGPHVAAVWRTA